MGPRRPLRTVGGGVIEGANVHVSMVGFDAGQETERQLDGQAVDRIHSNLTALAADLTKARRLPELRDFAFMGDTKGGAFDLDAAEAVELLTLVNPHGKPNSDVIVPWVNGRDVTQRSNGKCCRRLRSSSFRLAFISDPS